MRRWVIAAGLMLPACAGEPPTLPSADAGSATLGSTSDTTATSDAATTRVDDTSGSASSSATTGDVDSTSAGDDTTGGTVVPPTCDPAPSTCTNPSRGPGPGTCDVWAQDCAVGEKCLPVEAGGVYYTGCVTIIANPGQLGQACTLDHGGPIPPQDSCDVGLMCLDGSMAVAPSCLELCGCGPDEPTCSGENQLCLKSPNSEFGVCRDACDPLLVDCPPTMGCYAAPGTDGFVCAPSLAPTALAYDPCTDAADCAIGQLCSDVCGVDGCCLDVCDLSGSDPCAPGKACVPWYDGSAPPLRCNPFIGVCLD